MSIRALPSPMIKPGYIIMVITVENGPPQVAYEGPIKSAPIPTQEGTHFLLLMHEKDLSAFADTLAKLKPDDVQVEVNTLQ